MTAKLLSVLIVVDIQGAVDAGELEAPAPRQARRTMDLLTPARRRRSPRRAPQSRRATDRLARPRPRRRGPRRPGPRGQRRLHPRSLRRRPVPVVRVRSSRPRHLEVQRTQSFITRQKPGPRWRWSRSPARATHRTGSWPASCRRSRALSRAGRGLRRHHASVPIRTSSAVADIAPPERQRDPERAALRARQAQSLARAVSSVPLRLTRSANAFVTDRGGTTGAV